MPARPGSSHALAMRRAAWRGSGVRGRGGVVDRVDVEMICAGGRIGAAPFADDVTSAMLGTTGVDVVAAAMTARTYGAPAYMLPLLYAMIA